MINNEMKGTQSDFFPVLHYDKNTTSKTQWSMYVCRLMSKYIANIEIEII